MSNATILATILADVAQNKKLYWVLLDPDDFSLEEAAAIAAQAQADGVSGLLIGGSLIHSNHFDAFVTAVKNAVSIPVILFPGDASQIAPSADAILFTSLISGRNANLLIGEQVKGALKIKMNNIEPLPTGYMLIESGAVTSVQFMSNTTPLPREKAGIAAAHALAAQYLGMKLLYLEAGSGAKFPVPAKLIASVKAMVDIPIIVGGGIRTEDDVTAALNAGADIIVTGNMLNQSDGRSKMQSFAKIVQQASLTK